ncbi:MAG: DUF11 domain-containing protein [Spirochaetaceae bacterium]|nr:DUF11 domain-containing protein [Spirochaetaceae bacterium]
MRKSRFYELFKFTTLILLLIFSINVFSAPAMEWGRMAGGMNATEAANAPAHYRKDDFKPIDFTIILQVTGDPSQRVDTFVATLSIDSNFTIPLGQTKTKKISKLYPGNVKYIYWAITPPSLGGSEQNFANALQIDATYYIDNIPHTMAVIYRDIYVRDSFSTPQFKVTNNIVGDLLSGGNVEIIQTVAIEGGNPNQFLWGNFLNRYDTINLVDIKSDFPNHEDPQTYYSNPIALGTYHITYKFYINPNSTSDTVSLNNYFLGDTGSQWRTQDSETLGTGLPNWYIYPRGFDGKITECRSGIGIGNIPVCAYKMDNSVYDTRAKTLSDGTYSFGVKDTGTYKIYFNDPSHPDYDPSYSSYLDDNSGAGYFIDSNVIQTVSDCLYHYNSGVVYFDNTIYRNGDNINVTVEDSDLNIDPNTAESVDVLLSSDLGDNETLTLTELGKDSGIFSANILGLISSYTIGNGVLEASNGNTLTLEYQDNSNYNGIPQNYFDYAIIYDTTTSHLYFTDINDNILNTYALGNTVYIQLIDYDENVNNSVNETIAITLTEDSGQDTEHFTLLESTPASGIFRGNFTMNPTPAVQDNNIIETFPGDYLNIFYIDQNDPSDTSTNRAYIISDTNSISQFTDGNTKVYTYTMGEDNVNLFVNDPDRNRNTLIKDKLLVQVESASDTENFYLEENNVNSGVFVNTLPISLQTGGSSFDGIVNCTPNDTLTLTYTDFYNTSDTSTDTVLVKDKTISNIDYLDSLNNSTSYYYTGQNLKLQISDDDENIDPNNIETISAKIHSIYGNDTETLTLLENGANSGVFESNYIPITIGSANLENGIMDVSSGDSVIATYTDITDNSDSNSKTVDIIYNPNASSISFVDTLNNNITGYVQGENVFIHLIDQNLDLDSGNIDTGTVTLYNSDHSDTEIVIIYETAANSGEFISSGIPSVLVSIPGDGAITFLNNGFIYAKYTDPTDSTDVSIASAFTVYQSNASIELYDHNGDISNIFYSTKYFTIYLNDNDRNLDPYNNDTIAITILNNDISDTETLILTETGISTGIFEGIMNIDNGPIFSENSILSGFEGNFGEVRYSDLYPINSIISSNFMIKVLTNSLLYFTDDYGAVVNSYHIGQKAYLKLTDNDRNRNYANIDTITMTIHSQIANDTETVVLSETAVNSGVFTLDGILTSSNGANLENAILEVANSDTIIATYKDIYDANDINNSIAYITDLAPKTKTLHFHGSNLSDTFTGSNTLSSTITSTYWTQEYAFSENFTIAGVLTAYYYIDTGSNTTGTIDVYRVLSTSSEQLIASSDSFDILTNVGDYKISIFPAFTDLVAGDKIKVVLNTAASVDVYYNSYASDSRLEIPTNTYVNIDWSKPFYKDYANDGTNLSEKYTFYLGQTVYFREKVNDPFGSYDVLNSTGGRIYIAQIPLTANMNMVYDSGIEYKIFEYGYTFNNTGTYDIQTFGVESNGVEDSITYQVVVETTPSTIDFTDIFENNVNIYTISDTIYIKLTDLDKNLDPENKENQSITLQNIVNGDSETINLNETDLSTGIFKGNILSSNAAVTIGDNVLEAANNDTITVTYNDPIVVIDTAQDTAVIILATPSQLFVEDENKNPKANFKVGESFYAHIIDIDEDQNENLIEQVQVTFHSIIGNDTETVSVDETGINTGEFYSNLLAFVKNPSSINDGVFTVSSPDTITFYYIDENDASDTSIKTAYILAPISGVISFDKALYQAGETATLTLYDPDVNTDINSPQSAEIYAMGKTGDTEKVNMTEIANNSDTFTGQIYLLEDETPSIYGNYDGILHCSGDFYGDTITALYYDNSSPVTTPENIYAYSTFKGLPKYQLTKSEEYPIRIQGENQNYNILYRNYSTTISTNVSILDPVPFHTNYVSGGVLVGNTVTFSIGTLNPSVNLNTASFVLSVDALAVEGETITNIAYLEDAYDRIQSNAVAFLVGHFPQLTMAINDIPDPVDAGNNITYDLVVKNIGNTPAKNISVDANVPSNTTYVSGGAFSGNTVTFTLAALNTDMENTFTYIVQVDSPIANNTVINENAHANCNNNTEMVYDTESTTVHSAPDIIATKSVDVIYAQIGDNVNYTMTLTNNGTDTSYNVIVEDNIPFHTNYISSDGVFSGTKVTWNFASLAPSQSQILNMTVQVNSNAVEGEKIYNAAAYTDDFMSAYSYSNNVSFEVGSHPYFTIDKYSALNNVSAGDTIEYYIVVSNIGSDTAINVTVTDTAPAQFTPVSSNYGYTYDGTLIKWSLASLGINKSDTISIIMQADASILNGVVKTNYAYITYPGSNVAIDSYPVTVNSSSVVQLTKTGPSKVSCGDNFTYYIFYKNTAANTIANIVIYDTVPAHLSYVSGGVFDGTGVSFNLGTINANEENTLSFAVQLDNYITNGTIIDNRASLTGTAIDNSYSNLLQTTASSTPAISIEKFSSVIAVSQGETFTFSFKVSNTGCDTALNCVISDTIPTFINYVSGASSFIANVAYINAGDILPGESRSYTIVVSADLLAPDGAMTTNFATISGNNFNTEISNNVSIFIGKYPDLYIDKFNPTLTTFALNGTSDYTIVIGNIGDTGAASYNLSIDIPKGIEIVNTGGGTLTGSTLTFNEGLLNISNYNTENFTIKYSTPVAGKVISELLKTYITFAGTEKESINNTKYAEIRLQNDTYGIYLTDTVNNVKRNIISGLVYLNAMPQDFTLSSHVISPNNDGFKDEAYLNYNGNIFIIDGKDNAGKVITDGEYKIRFIINYANGQSFLYEDKIYITNHPENIIDDIKLYPNPVIDGEFTLHYIANYNIHLNIKIYNVSGIRVNSVYVDDPYKEEIIIKTENKSAKRLASGVYFIVLDVVNEKGERQYFGPYKLAIIN